MKENISKWITYAEAIFSSTALRAGIKNDPNEVQLKRMKFVGKWFDKIRDHFNVPLGFGSFIRSLALNAITPGASVTSGHVRGSAIDINGRIYGHVTNKQIFCFILRECEFTELIWEYPTDKKDKFKDCCWVHYMYEEGRNEREVLIKEKGKGYRALTQKEIDLILNS